MLLQPVHDASASSWICGFRLCASDRLKESGILMSAVTGPLDSRCPGCCSAFSTCEIAPVAVLVVATVGTLNDTSPWTLYLIADR